MEKLLDLIFKLKLYFLDLFDNAKAFFGPYLPENTEVRAALIVFIVAILFLFLALPLVKLFAWGLAFGALLRLGWLLVFKK